MRAAAALERRARVSPTSFLLTLKVEGGFPETRPGNFVSLDTSPELALPRPFAVAGRPAADTVELLIELRGPGTQALCELPIGSETAMLGPLGNCFTMPEHATVPVLVAGGIGVAGLRLLATELGRGSDGLVMLVGARSAELLLDACLPGAGAPKRVVLERSTDDGSAGHAGPVTDLLRKVLDEEIRPLRIYCCGPPAMISAVAAMASEKGAPCEALLEEMMACGVGACRGCVVDTRNGYRCVCTDGPVFDVAELRLGEYAVA
jgi:dihydroorotate dehydrogenase electron transfer subunit